MQQEEKFCQYDYPKSGHVQAHERPNIDLLISFLIPQILAHLEDFPTAHSML